MMILASSDIFWLNWKPLKLHCYQKRFQSTVLGCVSLLFIITNSDRLQKVTTDGRPKYAIKYPKSKKGGNSLIPVKSAATYGSRFFTYCSIYKINYLLNKGQEKKANEAS